MFPTSPMGTEENGTDTSESTVYIDSFTSLIQRAVEHGIRRLRQKNRQVLVLKKARPSFSREIRCMMYIYGDVEKPHPDSVRLVEKILRNQMNSLLEKTIRVSLARGRNCITHEEIVYLLRQKEHKLRRLFQYLSVKDANEFITKKNYHQVSGVINSGGKRVNLCLNFLKQLKRTRDFTTILSESFKDPFIDQRMKMRYFKTLEMDDDQYLEYAKKLQVSFFPYGRGEKFKKWIMADCPPNLGLTELALEILGYLARETVAEIVESSMRIQINAYLPDSYQGLYSNDFRMSQIDEACHTEHGGSANSSVLFDQNEETMDSTSTDCVNDFIDHSGENSESTFLNDSNLKLENATTNITNTKVGKDLSSMRHSRWQRPVSSFRLSHVKSLPLHPRSIREFMQRSTMPNYLNAHVHRRKLKEHVLCL